MCTSIFDGAVPTLKAVELQERLKGGNPPYVLDVRQLQEFQLGHIEGAHLIPLGELNRRINEVPRDRDIVCICATGHRSVPAAHKLMAKGYHVSHLKNGMVAWLMAKLPTQR